MRTKVIAILFSFQSLCSFAGNIDPVSPPGPSALNRPKLVVGIVIDQMRWDYLYRFYNRYPDNGGFKRLLGQGFSCENTFIPYTPTVTACGHTCIYTGSVPAIHGITGNDWWDYDQNKLMYCTSDQTVKTTGSNTTLGQMSPRNMLVTTISDELRLATNFQGKAIGIALKDRGAILPAGHSANAAYWYDNRTGDWITSSYYMDELPAWVKALNAKKLADKYYAQDWNSLFPLSTYTQSIPDTGRFPHLLKQFIGKNYGVLPATPYGNTLTVEMAKGAILNEQLGADSVTDLLAVSFSSPDYIGHAYGPNSAEAEDGYLRLDWELGDFLNFLDDKVGKGNYLLFLTADHGVAQVPAFLKMHNIPAGNMEDEKITSGLNSLLKGKTKVEDLVIGIINYQVFLNREEIIRKGLNQDSVESWAMSYLLQQPGIVRAFSLSKLASVTIPDKLKNAFVNGYYPRRSGDIQLLYQPQWIDAFMSGGTTHGVWNPYDAHIPLLWYGWHIQPGSLNREVYMTDIAGTLAAMLHIQMPSGSVGKAISEVYKQ